MFKSELNSKCEEEVSNGWFRCLYPEPLFRQQCRRNEKDKCTSYSRVIPLPCHPGTCPTPYPKTNECICDLKVFAQSHSDWPIAVMVGTATYAQMLDAAPGLFEPFPDYRTDGNSSNSIQKVISERSKVLCDDVLVLPGWTSKEHANPTPPNLVSTYLVEQGLSLGDFKRLLIRAVWGNTPDPRIESLIASSVSYRNPELTLGEILITFVIYTIIVSLVIYCILRSIKLTSICRVYGC